MTASIFIEPVNNHKGLLKFVKFPFSLYRKDPNWVPPFIKERLDFFNPKKNPFFEHAKHQLYLAHRGGELVGTIGAVVDENHNRVHHEQTGAFGFFECIDDQSVATMLLDTASDWVRKQGMNKIRGPFNFSVNQECGLLVDGFDEPPMVMMTYNPAYYERLITQSGYVKNADLFAYIGDIDELWDNAPRSLFRIADMVAKRDGIRIRKLNKRDMRNENLRIREVYNRSFGQQEGFVPMNEKECDHFSDAMKQLADPDLILIAENELRQPVECLVGTSRFSPGITLERCRQDVPTGPA